MQYLVLGTFEYLEIKKCLAVLENGNVTTPAELEDAGLEKCLTATV